MFFHTRRLKYDARPDASDPILAKQLQELLGGLWGEISVLVTHLFRFGDLIDGYT